MPKVLPFKSAKRGAHEVGVLGAVHGSLTKILPKGSASVAVGCDPDWVPLCRSYQVHVGEAESARRAWPHVTDTGALAQTLFLEARAAPAARVALAAPLLPAPFGIRGAFAAVATALLAALLTLSVPFASASSAALAPFLPCLRLPVTMVTSQLPYLLALCLLGHPPAKSSFVTARAARR